MAKSEAEVLLQRVILALPSEIRAAEYFAPGETLEKSLLIIKESMLDARQTAEKRADVAAYHRDLESRKLKNRILRFLHLI